jgi:predicted RNA binding protein YcfA (HicA-like mRNA interferase family)
MKRLDLIRHLEHHGCELLREGGNHTIYVNRAVKKVSAIPRHREIIEFTARKICKDLDIPRPQTSRSQQQIFPHTNDMTQQQVLDLYFLEARHQLVEIAAFLDRVERAGPPADFRAQAFAEAVKMLTGPAGNKAREVLLAFSDPTPDPIAAATTKAACGAWPGPTPH